MVVVGCPVHGAGRKDPWHRCPPTCDRSSTPSRLPLPTCTTATVLLAAMASYGIALRLENTNSGAAGYRLNWTARTPLDMGERQSFPITDTIIQLREILAERGNLRLGTGHSEDATVIEVIPHLLPAAIADDPNCLSGLHNGE
jgi:hypothetical protein